MTKAQQYLKDHAVCEDGMRDEMVSMDVAQKAVQISAFEATLGMMHPKHSQIKAYKDKLDKLTKK